VPIALVLLLQRKTRPGHLRHCEPSGDVMIFIMLRSSVEFTHQKQTFLLPDTMSTLPPGILATCTSGGLALISLLRRHSLFVVSIFS